MRIDVHAHYHPKEYLEYVERFGADVSGARQAPGANVTLEQRLDLLDRAGIRVQVLSVAEQQPYFANGPDAVTAAKLGNDLYAEICQGYGGHFTAFATVPLPHVDAALSELERALDTLGMVGVSVGCSVAGRPLDDARFDPFFAELDRREAVLFLHPLGMGCGPLVSDYSLNWTLGATFEDTIAALRLVLSGVTSRYPRIRIIVPHLGGTLPFLLWRIDGAPKTWAVSKPSEHLRRLWFDTVNEHTAALRCARDSFGADRLLFGTDFPYLAGARFDRCLSYVEQSDLPADEKTAILDQNAQALLRLSDR